MQELWAIIFKPWADEPAYHALERSGIALIGRTTLCGRRIGESTPMLPMKHAKKFGRPCRSCYGESK